MRQIGSQRCEIVRDSARGARRNLLGVRQHVQAFILLRLVLRRDERVEDGHHEQREQRADGHAGDEHDANAVASVGTGAVEEDQRRRPNTVGTEVIKTGRSRVSEASRNALSLVLPSPLSAQKSAAPGFG